MNAACGFILEEERRGNNKLLGAIKEINGIGGADRWPIARHFLDSVITDEE